MNFKLWLESVSISIKDADYGSNVKDISSLGDALTRLIAPSIPIRHDTIVMDGFDVSAKSGVINLYHQPEFSEQQIAKITQAVIYYLKELGVLNSYHKISTEI